MPFIAMHAVLAVALPLVQDAVIPPPARIPLPRPAAGAAVASANQNLVGEKNGKTGNSDYRKPPPSTVCER